MRIISQNGNFECEYGDMALVIVEDSNQIIGIFTKSGKAQPEVAFAEYDNVDDARMELRMLHKRYVSLGNNPGSYQFSMAETYRKSRGEYILDEKE